MTKTWYPLTGTFSWKTLAKRRSPRPLLVVHSGNTTIGRPADLRISSSECIRESFVKYGGKRPARHMICRRETWRNPLIEIGGIAECFWEDWILAEPVPVALPGLFVIETEFFRSFSSSGRNSGIGSTKTGLQLFESYMSWKGEDESWPGTHRAASQRISIHDAQLDTMISPAPGLQVSFLEALRTLEVKSQWVSEQRDALGNRTYGPFLVTVSTAGQIIPRVHSANFANRKVKIRVTAWWKRGTGTYKGVRDW